MDPCAIPNGSPISACHNCRRTRRRCDRSIPTCTKCHSTGQVCLGYGKLIHWTNSVASRGKMMGKTFTVTEASKPQPIDPHVSSTSLVVSSKMISYHEVENGTSLPSPSWCKQMDDPVFQDLSQGSKFYLSYYDRQVCKDLVLHDLPNQNPFRDLLALSSDNPVLQHIIVANSALHLANATANSPFTRDVRRGASLEAYKDALVAKNRALCLLSGILTNSTPINSDVVLASIMLFIKFELLDSGRNGWRFHTQGAKQLIAYLRQNGKSELSALNNLRNCLIANCAIYDILGTTLTASSLAKDSAIDLVELSSINVETQANNCLSCPPVLLQIIRDVTHCFQPPTSPGPLLKQSDQLLSIVDTFNPYTWASSLQQVSLSFDLEMRSHIGFAYKAAVKIYILRATVLANAESIVPDPLEDLVSEIVTHLVFIPPSDPFFKAICWPTFIAGAETNNPDQRAWVSSRFQTALQILPWGYLSSAIDLLDLVWARKSQKSTGADWLINLKLSENDWLIA